MKIYVGEKYLILDFFNEINLSEKINETTARKILNGFNSNIGLDGKEGGFGSDKQMIKSFLLGKNQNYEELDKNSFNIYFKENYSDIIVYLIDNGFLEKNTNSFNNNEKKGRIILTAKGRNFLDNYNNVLRRLEYYFEDYPNIIKIIISFLIGIITPFIISYIKNFIN